MIAGRDLDAQVAEKVMGWQRMSWKAYHDLERAAGRIREDWEDERPTLTYSWHDQSGAMTEQAEDMDEENGWHPSEDIAAAWEVVEKLHAQGMRGMALHTEDDGWRFTIQHPTKGSCGHDHWENNEGIADTAPLAICLAALKAVGCELPQETR